jgi:ABC-type lipoprotein release transport system permease subunit
MFRLPLIIALRYFYSRKKSGGVSLISIISAISLLGYVVGAMALVIVLSVFNGFEDVFQRMYNRFDPDMQITPATGKTFQQSDSLLKQLSTIDGINILAGVLEENVLVKYDDRQVIAKAKGVDRNFVKLTQLDSCLVAGEVLIHYEQNGFYALVGQEIAWKLAIDPYNVFKRMVLYVPSPGNVDLTNPEANFNKDIIAPSGIFSVQQEIDDTYIIVPIEFLRALTQKETQLSAIDIQLKSGANSGAVKKLLEQMLGNNFIVKNRFEQREAFYKIMRSEKLISYFILLFILFIAAANSIASLYLLMLEKKSDIHLLSYLGMTKKGITSIFHIEGVLIALTGGLVGTAIGVVLVWMQETYGFISLGTSDLTFSFSSYPVLLKWSDVWIVLITVLVLGLITSCYPARKAAQLAA